MRVKYKHLVITLMIIFTSMAVIDRFTTNIWPIYLSHPKSPIFNDDWTATTFVIVGWIAGRELIVSSSFIYLLQCKCIANWIFENAPSWLVIDDIHLENSYLHYHIGWLAIGLPVLLHSYLICLPMLNPINHIKIYLKWMRPVDTNTGFYIDNYHNQSKTVNISLNDLYALFIVSICFLLLFPFSINKKFKMRKFTLCMYLHLIAATLYGIELLRTPFTIHCWFFCLPIMILYVFDRICSVFYYRTTNKTKLICKYNIDKDYVILLLHIPNSDVFHRNDDKYLGNVYWINTNQYIQNKQFAHPFTTFYNHLDCDIESLLFTSAMRLTLSHRGHRFPIRTANKHQHVFYNSTLTPNPYLEMMRTNTIHNKNENKKKQNKVRQSSASESVNIYKLHLQKRTKQFKLFGLNENNTTHHQRSSAFSPNLKNLYLSSPSNCQSKSSKSSQSSESSILISNHAKYHNSRITNTTIPTVIVQSNERSTFSLPIISYNHSDDSDKSDKSDQSDEDENENKSENKNDNNVDISADLDDNVLIDDKIKQDYKWNVGIIMKVHHHCNNQNISFTQYIQQLQTNNINRINNNNIYSYGPYRSSFAHIIEQCLMNKNPIVLIGTGVGISYILDFLFYIRSKNIYVFEARVDIFFSCNSMRLFQWITDVICGPKLKKQENLHINAHLTSHNIKGYDDNILHKRRASIGRLSFETILRNSIVNTKVFFCGHPTIQNRLVTLCNQLKLKLYKSHSF